MAETGFGSLTYDPAPEYYDWGFGTPTPVSLEHGLEAIRGADTGFGSPFQPNEGPVFVFAEGDLIPEDGGVLIQVCRDWRGSFPDVAPQGPLGPFVVDIVNATSGASVKAIGDIGASCFTNFYQDRLPLVVPPLPQGDYNLHIEWLGGLNSLDVVNAFSVGPAPRCEFAYTIRQHIPSWLNKGPQEVELDPDNRVTSNLGVITKSIGEMLQGFYGRPCTATTVALAYGASEITVESTIGFPESGAVFVEDVRFTYTGKTTTTLTGVTSDTYFSFEIAPHRKVAFDAATA